METFSNPAQLPARRPAAQREDEVFNIRTDMEW